MPAQSVYLNTEIIVSNASISSPTEIVSFTLPSAGIWDVDYFANGTYTSGLAGGYYWLQLYDSNNQPVQYSDRKVNIGSPISGRYFITTTGPTTYKLKTYPDRPMVYRISPIEGRNGVIFSYAPSSPKGDTGAQGIQGVQGPAATIAVGTVTTGAPGSTVVVTNVGTSAAARFNFAIPQGTQGIQGLKGDTGSQGVQGIAGPTGPKGDTGAKGDKGTINITVQTRAPNNNEGAIGDIWYQI